MKKTELEKGLENLINEFSRESDSNTPDFILAEFMVNCLDAFELASNRREVWYGVEMDGKSATKKRKEKENENPNNVQE